MDWLWNIIASDFGREPAVWIGMLGGWVMTPVAWAVRGWVDRRQERRQMHRTCPWSDVEHKTGYLFSVRNISSEPVIVTGLHAESEKAGRFFRDRTGVSYPYVCNPGDSLLYVAQETSLSGEVNTIIEWCWEGDRTQRTTRRFNTRQ